MSDLDKELQKVINEIHDTIDETYVPFGTIFGIRVFGNASKDNPTPPIQFTSHGPGTDGNSEIVVFPEQFMTLAKMFLHLHRRQKAIRAQEQEDE